MFSTKQYTSGSSTATAIIVLVFLLFPKSQKQSVAVQKTFASETVVRREINPASGQKMVLLAGITQQRKVAKPIKKKSKVRTSQPSRIYKPSNSTGQRPSVSTLRSHDIMVTKYDRTALRIKPLMGSDVVATLNQGSKLIVLEREVSWYKVKVHPTGKLGYIHRYMVNRF